VPSIILNGPLVHQEPIVDSPCRRKVVRAGRRWGKTVGAVFCAVVGHGPVDEKGQRTLPGIASKRPGGGGWVVAWVAPDFKQNSILWRAIRKRFRVDPRVDVNEAARTVTLPGGGMLRCCSAENINAIRGEGEDLIGVIVEEGAHLDLEAALLDVIVPALLDHYDDGSWLLVISTTNDGHDGNTAHRVPSYFDLLCRQIMAGERPGWEHWTGDARDNPEISAEGFAELLAEYGPGQEDKRDREVYAKLLSGGLASPYLDLWSPAVHIRDYPQQLPEGGRIVAGMDWGYDHPGAFQLYYVWHNGYKLRKHLRWEYPFGRTTPNGPMTAHAVGKAIGAGVQRFGSPEFVVYDRAMNASTREGKAVNSVKTDVLSGWTEAVGGNAWKVPAFNENVGTEESRRQRKLLMVNVLTWAGNPEDLKPWQEAELTVDRSCSAFVSTVPYLTSDPLDPTKIDKKQDRENDFDAATYLMEQVSGDFCENTQVKSVPEDQHPGFDGHGKRKPRDWQDEDEWEGVGIVHGGYHTPEGKGGSVDGYER
jgi:hypothetical protein